MVKTAAQPNGGAQLRSLTSAVVTGQHCNFSTQDIVHPSTKFGARCMQLPVLVFLIQIKRTINFSQAERTDIFLSPLSGKLRADNHLDARYGQC